jgi:hypothetical protein
MSHTSATQLLNHSLFPRALRPVVPLLADTYKNSKSDPRELHCHPATHSHCPSHTFLYQNHTPDPMSHTSATQLLNNRLFPRALRPAVPLLADTYKNSENSKSDPREPHCHPATAQATPSYTNFSRPIQRAYSQPLNFSTTAAAAALLHKNSNV